MQGTLKQIQDYSQRSEKLKSSITEGEKEKEEVKKSKEASTLAMKESQKVTEKFILLSDRMWYNIL